MRSYYESMGKEDKIGNSVRLFDGQGPRFSTPTRLQLVGAFAFGCTTRCHLSVHSLAMPHRDLIACAASVLKNRLLGLANFLGGKMISFSQILISPL